MSYMTEILFIEQNKLRQSSGRALIAYLWDCAELQRKFNFFFRSSILETLTFSWAYSKVIVEGSNERFQKITDNLRRCGYFAFLSAISRRPSAIFKTLSATLLVVRRSLKRKYPNRWHLDKDNAKHCDKFKFNSILCYPLLLFIFTIVFPPMNLMFMTTQIN